MSGSKGCIGGCLEGIFIGIGIMIANAVKGTVLFLAWGIPYLIAIFTALSLLVWSWVILAPYEITRRLLDQHNVQSVGTRFVAYVVAYVLPILVLLVIGATA